MTEYQRHTPELGYAPADTRAEDRAMRAGERSPEQIEREIEETRDRMSQNIDALGERLSPSRIKERAKEKVRYTGSRVGNVVRDNAVPIGLVGAGVTWMMMKRGDHSGPRDRRRYTNGYSGPERRISDRSSSGLRSKVDKVTGTVGHAAAGVADSVSGAASTVKEKTGEIARRAGELGGEAKERARDMRVRAKGSVERNLEENPLAIAAGAAVMGLALGLLFPASRRENELMGATRDRLVDTTKDTVRSVKETATEAVKAEASERGDELKQAARGVVDSVKEAAGNVAQETKHAAQETVRSHRNNPRT